ncbi:MAG: hypothetical protein KF905_03795 [Flavobacteriales bacterium]|nr:hypothetical protein [Flavobacteriales bacterium]
MNRWNRAMKSTASTCLLLVLLGTASCQPATTETESPATDLATDTVQAPLNGFQVVHIQDGGRMEGELINGERHGAWVAYFQHGGIRSRANYEHGQEQGSTEVFHENGMTKYTGQYYQGNPVGLWIFYDQNGDQERTARYDSLGTLLSQE